MAIKVLMFGWEFPPSNSGGLGVACAGLASALVDRGSKVTFVLPRRVPVRVVSGVKFVFADVPIEEGVSAYIGSHEFERLYGSRLIDQVRAYARAAGPIAVRESFDVIHAHDWLSFGAGIEAKRVSGKPLIVHVHATQFDHTGGDGVDGAIYAMEKEGMEQADAVIAVSNYTKNIIVSKYGIDPAKIVVVHNGIEEGSFGSSPLDLSALKRDGTKIVLFLGRLTLMKGPDYFLRAARRVLQVYPRVLFVIAGSGDMERQIVREAASLGIANKVLFAGFTREQASYFRSADVFVMPSVSEPFGMVALEAAVSGTPVIISKQSGVSEVLSHSLKVDFWDVDQMANMIVAVLRHPGLYATLHENGSAEARGVTWQRAVEKVSSLYRSVA